MTIQEESPISESVGGNARYDFDFDVFSKEHVDVIIEKDDVETFLAYGTDYSVSLVYPQLTKSAGYITLIEATPKQTWLDAQGSLIADYKIFIRRDSPVGQNVGFENLGTFLPKRIEASLDKLTMIAQEDRLERESAAEGSLAAADEIERNRIRSEVNAKALKDYEAAQLLLDAVQDGKIKANNDTIGTNEIARNQQKLLQETRDRDQDDAINQNTADIAALPTGTAITGQISADEAKITANEQNIATNTTNIGTNAHDITSLSTGSVQSNINAVARLGGQINTLDEKVFTPSLIPGADATDNIKTNKDAIAKNKAAIAATPSLVAHDAKEDKILRLTSSPNSPVAPSLLTAITSGFVDPIYSTRVDFTSLVYNSTPPIQYTLALTEAPSLRIVKIGNNPPPKDAIFFPEGSLYITAKAGRVVADVPQTITLTFPSTVVTYTRPTKEPETITIVGPHFTIELEKYTYNFSGTAHALIPIGVGGVITTTGGTFEIDDMDVVEGNKGQRIIQVSVDKKLDVIWEKETTGVVADWFKLSTVGLDVVSNAAAIVAVEGDLNVYKGRIGLEGTAQEKAARVGKLPRVKAGGVTFDYIDEPSGGSGASKFVDPHGH